MKRIIAIIALVTPLLAQADMVESNFGFGPGSKPTYGVDYEIVKAIPPYIDFNISGNRYQLQDYVSVGMQYDHINYGLAVAETNVGGLTSFSYGAELGYMQNLTQLVYVKESQNFLIGTDRSTNLSFTLSIGFNL